MLTPQPKPWIMDIAPYVPGRATTDDGRKVAKLSSNENPLGTSEAAREAFRAAAGDLERYPDASGAIVREAIAARYGLDPVRVIYGNGSDEILHLAAGAFAGPGDEVIFVRYGFAVYEIAGRRVGAGSPRSPMPSVPCTCLADRAASMSGRSAPRATGTSPAPARSSTVSVFRTTPSTSVFPATQVTARRSIPGCRTANSRARASSTPVSQSMISFWRVCTRSTC